MLPNMISRKQRPFQEADIIRGHQGDSFSVAVGSIRSWKGNVGRNTVFNSSSNVMPCTSLSLKGGYRQEADRYTKSRDGGIEQECPECPRPADAIIISYIHQPEE